MVNGYLTDFDRLNMYCIDAPCHFIGFPRKISEMPRGLRDFVISCVPWHQLMLFLLLFLLFVVSIAVGKKTRVLEKIYNDDIDDSDDDRF